MDALKTDIFEGYENETLAIKVLDSYNREIIRLGLQEDAADIVRTCTNLVDLDARLDALVTAGKNQASSYNHASRRR